MSTPEQQKFIDWLTRCEAIAGSASHTINGYPEVQIDVLRLQLQRAAADGVDWRSIYQSIYESWHTRRPLLPGVDRMASLMEQDC